RRSSRGPPRLRDADREPPPPRDGPRSARSRPSRRARRGPRPTAGRASSAPLTPRPPPPMQRFSEIVDRYRVIFFDSYGVLKTSRGLLEGVPEALADLRDRGKRLYVLT